MNEQNETTQLRFLEETATRLRQNGFTVSLRNPIILKFV